MHHKPISGSLTLINEANFWPKVKIKYPTELKGQLYIPSINWFLMCRYCTSLRRIVNKHAYGLAIILCMIMTTILLNFYLIMKRVKLYLIVPLISTYLIIVVFLLPISQIFRGVVMDNNYCIHSNITMTIWYLKEINKSYTKIVTIKKVLTE
jgi:KUP system potassium uptake protein